ncbi:hypothetical protein HMPREF1008_00705 [Olsenella sp. oral taxon 809 str. F0356]|uniref:protein-ADP-ribose hydrolase n=1 Tax=Olsenella sp. oral taxon 809 TaxID=661086 RepID=UPI000231F317|nr:protein-ADP-ribose hydrolase [Olsenella sp. oral taxon 809]EHF02300.1 hypothetical protein HMPREF1008_00705 [Olsenella sp. oral taxon 809 str. F0356]
MDVVDDEREAELRWLIDYLEEERGSASRASATEPGQLWPHLRALMNVREPRPASDEFYARQDRLLRVMAEEKGVTVAARLPRCDVDGHLSLWRGDITALEVDAIVNAANSQLLGCWVPGHHCIDNAIHSYAGVQLREECARLMAAQRHEEPTGQAKLTSAYNLPVRHVVHTVGPIAGGAPTNLHRRQLADCYESCLDAASEAGDRSVAFCCISTGLFGFPQEEAARIAVGSVRSWLDEHPGAVDQVVFNVFLARDERIYRELLG